MSRQGRTWDITQICTKTQMLRASTVSTFQAISNVAASVKSSYYVVIGNYKDNISECQKGIWVSTMPFPVLCSPINARQVPKLIQNQPTICSCLLTKPTACRYRRSMVFRRVNLDRTRLRASRTRHWLSPPRLTFHASGGGGGGGGGSRENSSWSNAE